MKKCTLCNMEIKDKKEYTYWGQGTEDAKFYRLCKECFFKINKLKEKDFIKFDWDSKNYRSNCMCCNKKVITEKLHSFSIELGLSNRNWYNFCDNCYHKKFGAGLSIIFI